jgi:hypothetical protein
MKSNRLIPLLSILALPAIVHAHCGCTDSAGVCLCPSTGAPATPGTFSIGLAETVTDYERIVGKGTQAHGEEYDLRSYNTQLILGFQATDRLRLQANVPYLKRDADGSAAPPTDDGLGDISLLSAWRMFQPKNGRLDLFLGLELPTGDTDGLKAGQHAPAPAPAPVHVHDKSHAHGEHHAGKKLGHAHGEEAPKPAPTSATAQEMTLGSGSWDVLVGAAGHAVTGPLTWQAEVAYHLNQEGDHDYEFGDELTWRAGPFVALCQGAQLGVQASGNHRDRDERDGREVDVSGSDWVFLGPALNVQATGGWFGGLTVDLPVEREVNKQQMAPEWRGRLSVAKKF